MVSLLIKLGSNSALSRERVHPDILTNDATARLACERDLNAKFAGLPLGPLSTNAIKAISKPSNSACSALLKSTLTTSAAEGVEEVSRSEKKLAFIVVFIGSFAAASPSFAECDPYDMQPGCEANTQENGWEPDQSCANAWAQSAASHSCSGYDEAERSGDQCRLFITCPTGQSVYMEQDRSYRSTTIDQTSVFDIRDVSRLANCSGYLKRDGC